MHYGIDYQAPSDARRTDFEPGSIDCITSTDTLEHIPKRDLSAILGECRRLLREGGVLSVEIDYGDHYSYYDSHICVYNFLRYSDQVWRLFSQSLHYQNRLRHSDYLLAAEDAGFEVLKVFCNEASLVDAASLRRLPIAQRFHGYSEDDLAIKSSLLLLRKLPQ
jgi:ubiquinone/menaquinone biosynthesis C-methylase UbiE